MGVQCHGIIAGLENAVANSKILSATEMHAVLLTLDNDVVDEKVFKRAYLDGELRMPHVEAAEMFDAQILDVKKRELTAQAINLIDELVHAVDDDLQTLNRDVFVIGLGQRALVQQNVHERPALVRFFEEYDIAKLQRHWRSLHSETLQKSVHPSPSPRSLTSKMMKV